MNRGARARLLGIFGVFVGLSGCWRANIYPVTGQPASDGGGDGGTAGDGGKDGGGVDSRGIDSNGIDSNDDLDMQPATCPTPVLKKGDSSISIKVGSATRSYVLHIPAAYDGKTPVPLIVDFHGIGGSGWSEWSSSPYPAVTDSEGVVLAFPDGLKGALGTGWNAGPCCVEDVDDLGFARALVAQVKKTACIDPGRVYAVGVLTGGGMVYHLACQAADVFAAVAPAAFDLLKENVDNCIPSRPITEIAFRGTADPRVPYAGGASSLVPDMPITFLGAVATFNRWAQINRCTGSASKPDSNGCSSYSGCQNGVEVFLCTKQGGGDDPGDATIAWPILKRHSL